MEQEELLLQDAPSSPEAPQKETPAVQETPEKPPEKEKDKPQELETPPVEPPTQEVLPFTVMQQQEDIDTMKELTQLVQKQAAMLDKMEARLETVEGSTSELKAKGFRSDLSMVVMQTTEIPQAVKDLLLQDIEAGTLQTQQEVDARIQIGKAAVDAVQAKEAPPVFPGLSNIIVGKEPGDVNRIRSKLLWELNLTQAEQELVTHHGITPFLGIKEEYRTLSGDSQLSMRYDPDYFRKAIGVTQATITTATYPDFLQDVLTKRMEKSWDVQDKSWLRAIKVGDAFTDTRPEDEFVISRQPEIPTVAENAAYADLGAVNVDTVRSTALKYGGLIPISEETILNDQVGFVKERTDMATIAMNDTLAHAVWKLCIGYSTAFNDEDLGDATESGATGGVLYHIARGNYVDGSIENADDIKSLVDLMFTQVDEAAAGETAQPLVLTPARAICEITKRGFLKGRINGEYEPGRDDNFPNILSLNLAEEDIIGIHPYYLHGKPEALILLPDPMRYAGIEVRYFRGKSTPDLVYEGNQQPPYGYVFSQDRMTLKLKMRARITRKRKKAFFGLFPA